MNGNRTECKIAQWKAWISLKWEMNIRVGIQW